MVSCYKLNQFILKDDHLLENVKEYCVWKYPSVLEKMRCKDILLFGKNTSIIQ